MKKKIEIELDIPECLNPVFLHYLTMVDDDFLLGQITGLVTGYLYNKGEITIEEALNCSIQEKTD